MSDHEKSCGKMQVLVDNGAARRHALGFRKNAVDQKTVTPHFTVPDTETVTALQKLFDS